MAQTFTQESFDKDVLKSPVPVLVDFWAPWCGPCKMIAPIVEELAAEYDGKGAKVGKMNVDENGALAQRLGIMSIPTLMVFKGGAPVGQIVGAVAKDRLVELLKKAMA
jgi:thioredoxin 1